MKYPGIELDENNRVRICPICENEYIPDGDYCQICGTMIVNRCMSSECGIVLSGESRYCHVCGGKSSFFQSSLLKDWKTIKRKYDVAKIFSSIEGNDSPSPSREAKSYSK